MYPGLVNNTTIIWFMPWPGEALLEVANKYITDLSLDGNPNDLLDEPKKKTVEEVEHEKVEEKKVEKKDDEEKKKKKEEELK